ncbi:MAG: hypothetical protein AAGC84_19870, partial [Pseudomonas sp.]
TKVAPTKSHSKPRHAGLFYGKNERFYQFCDFFLLISDFIVTPRSGAAINTLKAQVAKTRSSGRLLLGPIGETTP